MSSPAPRETHENWLLPDGSAATLRPIRPGDRELVRAFVRNLSPESRFMRFMGEVKELSPDLLERSTHPDPAHEAAYVVIRSTDAGEEEIGVARYALNPDGESCEFAVVVADAWQGKGIGGRLMRVLTRDARVRGIKRIEGYVLATNVRMLEFCRKLGFAVDLSPGDATVRIVRRAL